MFQAIKVGSRRNFLKILLAAMVALTFAPAANAMPSMQPGTASMARAGTQPIGLQDDESLKYNTAKFLARARKLRAKTIRVMIPYNRWYGDSVHPPEATTIVNSICAAKDDGKRVIATLLAMDWNPTVRQWVNYSRVVLQSIPSRCVDSWSVMNEPNHDRFGPAIPGGCKSRRCVLRRRGFVYRRIYDRIAPLVKYYFPRASLQLMDQAPSSENYRFAKAFFRKGKLKIRAKILAVHPYCVCSPRSRETRNGHWALNSIEDARRFARQHGLKLWVTEWAWPPSAKKKLWFQALRRFRRAGVKLTVIYNVKGPDWNTKMKRSVFRAIAKHRARGRNSRSRAAFAR
jgi:hypothetical protein